MVVLECYSEKSYVKVGYPYRIRGPWVMGEGATRVCREQHRIRDPHFTAIAVVRLARSVPPMAFARVPSRPLAIRKWKSFSEAFARTFNALKSALFLPAD